MSTEIMKEIVCPQCGESQKYRILAGINARENPELRERVLDETLFDWRCGHCNYFAAMVYPFLYTDPDLKLVVSVAPAGTDTALEPTEAVRDYTKRSVKNLAELKEKILVFEAGYDDVAVELVKDALCAILQNSYQVSRLHAYFSRLNTDTGELEFAVFLPRQSQPVVHSTRGEVYKQSQEVLRSLDYRDPEGFVTVDARLARRLIAEYKAE